VYDDRISDLSFKTRVSESLKTAEIAVRAEIEGCGKEVLFEISDAETVIAQGAVAVVNGVATATLRAQRPKLWYPHTYGGQPLYLISASLRLNNTCLDICKKRFGIRKARVVQHRLKDASGTSFYVEINNIPIFCGGSNWIPGDNYIPRITAQRYRDWVKTAVESKQVMLRVWGGGIYEEQAFYDAADEMGILVWQDFLFACGNYPANKDFLDLVEQEAIANIKQLRHHPSIVVFAGNNEDYQFCETENLGYNPRDRNPENWLRSTFPARYIYEKVLADVCSTLIPDIYYHFSSPYGGKATSDPTVGDIHQWNIWHGTQQPYQDFPSLIGRFITEFGMEALPCIDTVDSFLTNGREDLDRYALSSTLDFHNKADGHSRRLAVYMDENIRYTFDPLEHYIYYTQLMQAECVTAGYRSAKRDWRGPGSEGCAGMLVWQLNDCWPGTSWAIVDYYMRPKLAYYAVKRELQPITIGVQRAIEDIPGVPNGRRTGRKTEIWAVNLSLEPHDVQITIYSHNLTTNRRAKLTDQPERLLLLSNRSTEITTLEIPVSDQDSEEANQTVIAAYLHDRSGKMLTRAVNWPEPLKWVHTHKPTKIDIRLIGRNGGGDRADSEPIAILLSSEVCIKALQLEVTDSEGRQTVVFEDNGLDLVVGEEVMVGVRGLNWGDEKRVGFRHMGMRVR